MNTNKITISLSLSQLRSLHQMISAINHNKIADAAVREMVKHLMVNLFLKITRKLLTPAKTTVKFSLRKAEAGALLYTLFCIDESLYGPYELAVQRQLISQIEPNLK